MKKIGIIAVLILIGLGFVLPVLRHAEPSLYVHIESIPWSGLTIESSNLEQPMTFTPTAECKLSPIQYGVYRVGIHLQSGQTVWSQFFHSDLSRRHRVDRVDIFITNSSKSGYLRFRQTVNENEQVFEGDAPLEEVTREKPFRLNWI